MLLVVAVVAVVVAVATYLTWIARRLDRLTIRTESLWAALDSQLAARAFAAHELAHQIDDPELHAAARAAGDADGPAREGAENRLSRALHAAWPAGIEQAARTAPAAMVAAVGIPGGASGGAAPTRSGGSELAARILPPRSPADRGLAQLPECARQAAADLEIVLVRVALARHFYNDAVRDLLALRGRRLPRVLRLYGRAQAPSYFEFDSSVPESRSAL